MKDVELSCTKCGRKYRADAPNFRCGDCSEPLELPEVRSGRIRTEIGPWGSIFQRYSEFFPFDRAFPELDL